MSTTETDQAMFSTLGAVFKLVARPELRETLKSPEAHAAALQELGLPGHARRELLNLVARLETIEQRGAAAAAGDSVTAPPAGITSGAGAARAADAELDKATRRDEQMQLEAFVHIRQSFYVAMVMSVALFVVGLMLMVIAVNRALHEGDVSSSTLTIAGLGLADFVLLFFRQPWKDVAVNLTNAQRTRTIATTYLVGLTLLHRKDKAGLEMLEKLTNSCIGTLDRIANAHGDR
jgi:hypothetical protein